MPNCAGAQGYPVRFDFGGPASAAGLDYHLTPDTVLGFALAGGGTNWNLSQGLGSGKSDAFQAGLYAPPAGGRPISPGPSPSPIIKRTSRSRVAAALECQFQT